MFSSVYCGYWYGSPKIQEICTSCCRFHICTTFLCYGDMNVIWMNQDMCMFYDRGHICTVSCYDEHLQNVTSQHSMLWTFYGKFHICNIYQQKSQCQEAHWYWQVALSCNEHHFHHSDLQKQLPGYVLCHWTWKTKQANKVTNLVTAWTTWSFYKFSIIFSTAQIIKQWGWMLTWE